MRLIETEDYLEALKNILRYIAKDKKSAALAFSPNLEIEIHPFIQFSKNHSNWCKILKKDYTSIL